MKIVGIVIAVVFVLFAPMVGIEAADQAAVRVIRMKCTGYCPCTKCCGSDACGLTSTGKDATTTIGVAADSKLLPYGTKLRIPGIEIMVVDDIGGAMRQDAKRGIYHIDIRFKTHQEARQFGVKWLDVEVLGR